MATRPIKFRAVHTKNLWRKATHETFERATSIGNRSALALFEHRNDAVNYTEEGEPLFVVVWHEDDGEGYIFKSSPNAPSGMHRSSAVPRSVIDVWEKQRSAPENELEQHFASSLTPTMDCEFVEFSNEDIDLEEVKTIDDLNDHLSRAVATSASLSSGARLQRLETARRKPQRIKVSTYAFNRNPDVIVEVLIRANGLCERCRSPAPFNRATDGSPYLEVHHITQLSHGGEDTVSNAKALCPNCHRHLHFGEKP